MKNAYPLQLAEYVTKNGMANEPAFASWVKPTMKQRKLYIKSSHTRYAKRTHKFGIRVPRTVEEALRIDKETNTRYWHDAIQKEMLNTRVASRFLEILTISHDIERIMKALAEFYRLKDGYNKPTSQCLVL